MKAAFEEYKSMLGRINADFAEHTGRDVSELDDFVKIVKKGRYNYLVSLGILEEVLAILIPNPD